MSIAIVYTSQYGSTRWCAERLADLMQPPDVRIMQASQADKLMYTCRKVVLGIPVYAGSTTREMRMLLKNYRDCLEEKLVGVFFLCWDATRLDDYLERLSLSSLAAEKPLSCFGAVLDFSKMTDMEISVLQDYTGHNQTVSTINEEQIISFANQLQSII